MFTIQEAYHILCEAKHIDLSDKNIPATYLNVIREVLNGLEVKIKYAKQNKTDVDIPMQWASVIKIIRITQHHYINKTRRLFLLLALIVTLFASTVILLNAQ